MFNPGLARGQSLGLLVKIFPKLSETFILEEILGLERQGVPLKLYALAVPTDTLVHAAVSRVRARLTLVPECRRGRLGEFAWCHLRLFGSSPLRYAGALASATKRGGASLRDFVRAGWLAIQLRDDQVEHLHTHFISTPADLAELTAQLLAMPFSISAHAKDIYLSKPDELRRKLTAARFTVTCTEFNRKTLAAIAPDAAIHRMYHGVDQSQFHPRLRQVSAGPPLLLSVGRLRSKKGLDTLIEACRLLRDRGLRFRCQIIGYGEEQAKLTALIGEHALAGQVQLLGALPREQVIAAYAGASVYVQPSRIAADGDRDGIPNVLLEAMAIGLPVIASRVSGIPELIEHGVNGWLVDADQPAALADAIAKLLDEPALAAQLTQRARASVVAGFDNDRNLLQLQRLFKEARPHARHDAWPDPQSDTKLAERSVAYVMNGYPRLSETFITHEIHQLERSGLRLRLFSVKREREDKVHPVVAAVTAPLTYLPDASSLSNTSMFAWLRRNLPVFWRANATVLRHHPIRYLGALGSTLAMSRRYRQREKRQLLRKVFIKEFLQAGQIAAELIRAGDVGHLHGHFCHGVATITWLVSHMTKIPFSFTAHAKDLYQADLNPGDLLERKLGAARFVATCTCANASVLRARHPRPDEVHAIYHGLDVDYFSPSRRDRTTAAPMILSVGRFVEKKGFEHLIEACAMLKQDGLRFRCVIVGERGDAYERIRDLIAARGLQALVQLREAVTQDELRDIYRGARVFALPCQVTAAGDRDGFPNVLAEAMAMEIPVVSTDISGIPEMIENEVHGLLVPTQNVAALAEALRRVLLDDGLHQRLAQAARQQICERFDSRRTTIALRDLFCVQLRNAASPEPLSRLETAA